MAVQDLQFPYLSTYSELTLVLLALRLLGYLHYSLVIQNKASSLFSRAALKVYDIKTQKELANHVEDPNYEQMQKIIKLLLKVQMWKMTQKKKIVIMKKMYYQHS